ncbi:MAG: flagellar biosynthetic protein FliR, partial [Bdellovibrionaceae bacterium]|nr:flagellar biosynthetic protein FliR [Pseudobdellovibrionaceae bacterium]
MNIYQLTEIQILTFALVMLRITGFVFSAAIIGSGSVPVPVRVLLSLILTITVWPTLNITSAVISGFGESLIYLSLTEVLLGLLIGYLTRIFFLTVEMAGEIASSSMGLSAAQIFNPSLQANTSSIGQFYNILATLLFFSILG